MRNLHPDVVGTAIETVIKENAGFRLRLEKWESLNPKGYYNIDLVQESLDEKGEVSNSSTYNFHMTKEELQRLSYALTL